MKIAVLSDIHDHIWNLAKALESVKSQNCEALIFCGDLCSPFTVTHLTALNIPVYACLGNNDGDPFSIYQKANSDHFKLWPLGNELAHIELDNQTIAFCHYPKLAHLLAKTGDYKAVFHGHTHVAYQEQIDQTLLANPGSVCGIVGGQPGAASFGIYDTNLNEFTHVPLLR